jgi:hypothetical protein
LGTFSGCNTGPLLHPQKMYFSQCLCGLLHLSHLQGDIGRDEQRTDTGRAFRALDELAGIKSESLLRRCTPGAAPPAIPPAADPPEMPSPAVETTSKNGGVATEPPQGQIDRAGEILASAGMRLMELEGVTTVGLWSDLDSPQVRAAIAAFHPGGILVRYLDGDVPMRFKLRRVPGEPVPANVLAAMEQEPNQPWAVRDRRLEEIGWSPDGIPWAEWKAASLNKLFEEQGVTGEPGRITPETIRRGERGKE